ncbi:Hypothetical protein PBC10988_7670 [Planctomycetales bacterium 10988]|nr:Hypothetical protein PBC10988_7670 [Planctomycetales bacterium 10988]
MSWSQRYWQRRDWLRLQLLSWIGLSGSLFLTNRQAIAVGTVEASPEQNSPPRHPLQPSRFLIACSTAPYQSFTFLRAIQGIAKAGFRYVAWGSSHVDFEGESKFLLKPDDATSQAKLYASQCRDLGLEPLSLQSGIDPEEDTAVEALTKMFRLAAAAGIPQVILSGRLRKLPREKWAERLRHAGHIAQDFDVTLLLKSSEGELGSGAACQGMIEAVDHPHVKLQYDAGGVMQALNIDPLPDLRRCHQQVWSLALKDHRLQPQRQHCGPGLGVIDHYQLLGIVAAEGRILPLCVEELAAPLLPPPRHPDELDDLAKRSFDYLNLVAAGLQANLQTSANA